MTDAAPPEAEQPTSHFIIADQQGRVWEYAYDPEEPTPFRGPARILFTVFRKNSFVDFWGQDGEDSLQTGDDGPVPFDIGFEGGALIVKASGSGALLRAYAPHAWSAIESQQVREGADRP